MRQELLGNPNIIAVVQTSPQARYEHMIRVLDGIQSAGATRFSLQLLEG
jgi:biopolymer transport protein ExbD